MSALPKSYDRKTVAALRRRLVQGKWATDRLEAWRDLEPIMTEVLWSTVQLAREQGFSWADIGAALGISEQAAHKRFAVELGE